MARSNGAVATKDRGDEQGDEIEQAPRALTAAAYRIDLTKREDREREKRRRRQDQGGRAARVWEHYDDCGELWYGTEFVGNACSRVRLYAGRREADGSVAPLVVPEPDGDATTDPPPPLTPAEQAAVDAVERLRGASGSQSEIMRGFGRLLSLVGDSELVGYERPPADGLLPEEVWEVLSQDELVVTEDGMARKRSPGGSAADAEPLPEDAFVLRVWRPHPRWSALATAPTFAILDRLDELAILSRMIRAQARSRIANAGILVIPAEVDEGRTKDPSTDQGEGGGSGGQAGGILVDLLEHFVTPIADEGSASAVVPYLIKLPGEFCDKVRHFAVDRPIDATAIAERKELIERIANGLDMPAEVLTGLGDVNHWNAWQIDDSTFRAHLEPLVLVMVNSLTAGYLRPSLEASAHDATGLVIWYDPSDLVVHPDRAKDALEVHREIALSDAALRKYHGFPEDDAPSEEEQLLRLVLHRGAPDPGIVQEVLRRIDPSLPRAPIEPGSGGNGSGGEPGGTSGPTQPEHGPPPEPSPGGNASARRAPLALLASVRRPARAARLATLGPRLAKMDRGLLTRLQAAADATVTRALERAGARVRTAANARGDRTVQDALRAAASPESFCAQIGPSLVAALGVDEHELLTGSMESLGPRFDADVRRTQEAALAAVVVALDLDDDDAQLAALRVRQEEDRRGAWTAFLTALTALASRQLYDPTAGVEEQGEAAASLRVPAGVVREALVRAGGAEALRVDTGAAPAGLVATGSAVTDLLASNGVTAEGYVWDYGDPAARKSPFPPHEDLDGVEFASWEDPVLATPADADWVGAPFVFPGDHGSCLCLAAPSFAAPDTQED